jgi:hypothetical protein
MLITLSLSLFLLVILAAFEVLPITNGNNDLTVIQQVNLQLARHEYLVKDVYLLTRRDDTTQAQAISELQIQEPQFERTQQALMDGDAALGLPPASPAVKSALIQAQGDYLAIVTAIKTILKTPGKSPDPIQVEIVSQHDRRYIAAMYPAVALMQQDAQTRLIQLLVLKMSLIGVVVLLVMLKYLLFTQRVVRKMIEDEDLRKLQEGDDAI